MRSSPCSPARACADPRVEAALTASDLREGWLARDGVRLHYVEWPGEGPPLFLLHGLSSNARFWGRLAARLPGRRAIALDQRSHGLSESAREGDGTSTFVADAAHALATIAGEPALVVGHSWGAAIALELAAAHPDRCAGLAFVDGPAWPLAELLEWDSFAARAQPPLPRYDDLAAAIAAARASLGPAWGDDLVEFVRAGHRQVGGALVLPLTADVRREILRDMHAARQDLRWLELRVPALAAFATRKSDLMREATKRAAERMARVAPKVRVRWYDSPHDIPLHVPDELARDIATLERPQNTR